jgi:hypothetical protein
MIPTPTVISRPLLPTIGDEVYGVPGAGTISRRALIPSMALEPVPDGKRALQSPLDPFLAGEIPARFRCLEAETGASCA